MKHLLIIGARGFGREVFNLAIESVGFGIEFDIKGFLDDNGHLLDELSGYPPILDSVEHYCIEKDDIFVCALGDVFAREHYASIISSKGGEFINLIHRNARIGKNSVIGSGCIIFHSTSVSCDICIGDFCTLHPFTTVGHDSRIGNYTEFEPGVKIGGFASIGDFVTIHPNGVVIPHKRLSDKVIVGAGSVVIKNVKEGVTVIGNPATILKI